MHRQLFITAFALSCSAAVGVLACGGTDSSPAADAGPDAAPDATPSLPDAAPQLDAAPDVVDAGPDTSAPTPVVDAGDRTEEIRSVGVIRVGRDFVVATFSEDDTVIRYAEAPNCILVVRSASKPYSPAGTVTVAGEVVGAPGGPDAGTMVGPGLDNRNLYVQTGVLVTPPTADFTVDVSQGPFTPAFPELLPQTMRPSLSVATVVTSPDRDAGPELAVPTDKALTITWTVPAGQTAEQSFIFDLELIPSGQEGSRKPRLICDAPLAKGTLTIPAAALAEAKAVTLPFLLPAAYGSVGMFAGGYKVLDVKNATYILRAAAESPTDNSTTFGPYEPVKLD